MPQRIRELCTLALLGLLPFHALGVTVLTRIVDGPNQPPMGALALWKEGILALVLLLACVEFVTTKRDQRPEARRKIFSWDVLDVCIIVLAASLLFSTFLVSGLRSPAFVYGIRYDLVPLAAFVVLRRVDWSEWFRVRAPFVLAIAACIAAVYALITLALPASFFTAIGYSDLHSLYIPGRPIAAFQQIGGSTLRRLQGPMSGPNQFGIWLAAVLPFALTLRPQLRRIIAPLLLLAIVLSFSRAAWIATAVALVIALWPQLKKLSVTAVTTLCIGVLAIAVTVLFAFPSVILRVESSIDHLRNPLEAARIMLREPLGRGLGSAGPANNRVADACVYQEEGSDASWAVPHADLCVFVGEAQVQPIGRSCTCPLLPENWYLQLGVEGGWLAFITFIALVFLALKKLRTVRSPVFLSLLVVSIAALFLHAWEDAAVAYAVWTMIAVTLPPSTAGRTGRTSGPGIS